ncbi:anaerobic selenocysteine-containing dehydrogenase [Bradyrhizobium japonicum]
MQRRDFLKLSVGTAAAAAFASRANAQGAVKEIRIGYQKTGVLVITRLRLPWKSISIRKAST